MRVRSARRSAHRTGSPDSAAKEQTLFGDHLVVGKRLGGICPVPSIRPGNRNGHLRHQRGRVDERPAAAGRRDRGHFPTVHAALKCLHLAIMSLDPTGRSRKRWINRWKGLATSSSRDNTSSCALTCLFGKSTHGLDDSARSNYLVQSRYVSRYLKEKP